MERDRRGETEIVEQLDQPVGPRDGHPADLLHAYDDETHGKIVICGDGPQEWICADYADVEGIQR